MEPAVFPHALGCLQTITVAAEEQQQWRVLCSELGCCGGPSSALKDCIDSSAQDSIMHIRVSPTEWYILCIFMTEIFFFLLLPFKPWNDALHELEEGSSK
jgi:hypothetical protein